MDLAVVAGKDDPTLNREGVRWFVRWWTDRAIGRGDAGPEVTQAAQANGMRILRAMLHLHRRTTSRSSACGWQDEADRGAFARFALGRDRAAVR